MSRSLKSIHREFLDRASQPMRFGKLPVEPKEPEAPVLATERWISTGKVLQKRFRFRRPEDRRSFVLALFDYESSTQHHARMLVDEDEVVLQLTTRDLDRVTEVDKEYARFADVLFRDLVYHPSDVR